MKKLNLVNIYLVCIYLFIISLLCLLIASDADAQTWDWSPPASHHAAVCRVSAFQENDQETGKEVWHVGSGVYVEYGKLRGVLTAAHIITGRKTVVQFSDGMKSMADSSTIDKFGHDIAFIFLVAPGFITPVSMAKQDPLRGDRVELVTRGGPEHRLRSFWATVKIVGPGTSKYDCDVLNGDSGGAILNTQGQLIGIQSFGSKKIVGQTAWGAYRGSGSASCGRIRDFLGRIAKCGPKGCPLPKNKQFYPPASLVPVQKPDRPVPQPPVKRQLPNTPLGLSIDYDKLVKMILAKIDPEDFRGPVGPVGPAGETGLRGGPGLKGRNGPMGPSGTVGVVDLDDLAKRIKKRIQGSIRVKVRPIQSK